ncbi:MAG: hypothetical protein ABI824_03915 [Acidobacteriota bacterium]
MLRQSHFVRLLLAASCLCAVADSQTAGGDDFHVYRDGPRITLTAQRLRLLERERERRSPRWENFEAAVKSGQLFTGVPSLEPGIAGALYYRITKDEAIGRKAILSLMTLGPKATPNVTDELRQLAIVFDWCAPLLTKTETDELAAKLELELRQSAAETPTVASQNARVLAAIALADRLPDAGDSILRDVVEKWWRGKIVPEVAAGRPAIARQDMYLLFEMMHAIRDNTKVDLRESLVEYFKMLPLEYIVGHYPSPFPGSQNDVRVPVYAENREPDTVEAGWSRAAGLALVAYDTNAVNHQFVQGWLMNDRFQMRDALGATYEFLWANPYQPGLSYATLPLVFHDPQTGHVFARSSWDDDATWIGYFDGTLQLFQNSGVQTLRPGTPLPRPLRIGTAVITKAVEPSTAKLRLDSETLFVLGLTPNATYGVEVDDQELDFLKTDVGGTLVVKAPEGTDAGIRVWRVP